APMVVVASAPNVRRSAVTTTSPEATSDTLASLAFWPPACTRTYASVSAVTNVLADRIVNHVLSKNVVPILSSVAPHDPMPLPASYAQPPNRRDFPLQPPGGSKVMMLPGSTDTSVPSLGSTFKMSITNCIPPAVRIAPPAPNVPAPED